MRGICIRTINSWFKIYPNFTNIVRNLNVRINSIVNILDLAQKNFTAVYDLFHILHTQT